MHVRARVQENAFMSGGFRWCTFPRAPPRDMQMLYIYFLLTASDGKVVTIESVHFERTLMRLDGRGVGAIIMNKL